MGALVRQHGGQLRLVEHGQGAAGEHDGGRAARDAVRGGPRVVQDHGAGAGQRAAGQDRRLGVRAAAHPGALRAAAVPPQRHGGRRRDQHRQGRDAKLVGRAAVDDRSTRPAGHRPAQDTGEAVPVSRHRSEQKLDAKSHGGEDARHRGEPRGEAEPDAYAAAGQCGKRRRASPRDREGVAEQQQRGPHDGCRLVSLSSTARSTCDCSPSIWATKWLSTASVSPAPAIASRISRALYSSRLATAV